MVSGQMSKALLRRLKSKPTLSVCYNVLSFFFGWSSESVLRLLNCFSEICRHGQFFQPSTLFFISQVIQTSMGHTFELTSYLWNNWIFYLFLNICLLFLNRCTWIHPQAFVIGQMSKHKTQFLGDFKHLKIQIFSRLRTCQRMSVKVGKLHIMNISLSLVA